MLQFLVPEVIREFLVQCPVSDMRLFVASLLQVALTRVYDEEHEQIATFVEASIKPKQPKDGPAEESKEALTPPLLLKVASNFLFESFIANKETNGYRNNVCQLFRVIDTIASLAHVRRFFL